MNSARNLMPPDGAADGRGASARGLARPVRGYPHWPGVVGLLVWLLTGPIIGRGQTVPNSAGTVIDQTQAPFSLEECIRLAQTRNLTAQRADLNTAGSQSALTQFRANRYPTLNGTGTYNYSAGRSIDPGTNQYVNQKVGSVNAGLTGAVTLFNGGRIQYTIRQYGKDLEATRLEGEATRLDLALQVTQAYVAILQNQELAQTARTQQTETEAQLRRTRQLLAAGSVAENNVLQVQAQLASDQFAVITAENTLATSLLTLRQLLEEPPRPDFAIQPPTHPEPEETGTIGTDDLFDVALTTQPQIRGSRLRVESADFSVKSARAQLLPRISLSGNLNTTYSTARGLFVSETVIQQQVVGYLNSDQTMPVYSAVPVTTATRGKYGLTSQFQDNFSPSAGVTLNVPILNNLTVRRTIQVAVIAVSSARLDERNVRNQLRKNVEQAQNDLLAARRQYASSRDQVRFQEQAYRNTEVKYRLGASNAQDLLIEKNKFAKALSDRTQAKYDYLLRIKVLDYYQGNPLTL